MSAVLLTRRPAALRELGRSRFVVRAPWRQLEDEGGESRQQQEDRHDDDVFESRGRVVGGENRKRRDFTNGSCSEDGQQDAPQYASVSASCLPDAFEEPRLKDEGQQQYGDDLRRGAVKVHPGSVPAATATVLARP